MGFKKKPKSKSNRSLNEKVDIEKGGSDYKQLDADADIDEYEKEYEPVQFTKDQTVWCCDFGEELQQGTVIQDGRQRPKINQQHAQIPRDERPRVLPVEWDKSSNQGYTWDQVLDKQPDNDEGFWNGAHYVKLASLIMLCIFAWGALALGENVIRLAGIAANPNEPLTAFDLAKLGNDTISVVLSLLVYLLWSTLCFKFVHVRHMWSWRPRILKQSMMPGGFIPRPSAVSLGVLMFFTSVFISEREVAGASLYTMNNDGSYTSHIGHGESCRADVREESQYQDDWFSRLDRLAPLGCYFGPCPEGSRDPGCQLAGRSSLPLVFTSPLNASHMPFPNFKNPFVRTSHITQEIWHNFERFLPSLFGQEHLDENLAIDEDHACIYQCVKWKAYGFNTLVSKVGTIGAGNAIVTKMTETVTGFLGRARVTAETTPLVLGQLFEAIKPGKGPLHRVLHKNAAVPAFIFGSLRLFLAFFVYKIDDHGFFTVDYYVSQVLLFAVCTSIICRLFNVFRWEHVVYSANLWTEGSEDFIIPDGIDGDALDSKPKKVDLLVWLHMSFEERAYLLIMYARKLPEDPKKWNYAKVECFIEHSAEVSFSGESNTKQTHTMRIKRGLKNDAWPQGTVTGKEGDMALVKWNDEYICADKDENGMWLHELKSRFLSCQYCKIKDWTKDVLCQQCERYKAATTTKVQPMYLFDKDEKNYAWGRLLTKYIGDLECQDQVRGKILRRLRRDTEDQKKMIFSKPKPEAQQTPEEKAKVIKHAQKAKDKQEQHSINHRQSLTRAIG